MVQVSVVGATGYTGSLLVELLLRHPLVKISQLAVRTAVDVPYSQLNPFFLNRCDQKCVSITDVDTILERSDVIFFCLPHKVSMEVIPRFLSPDVCIIDLSGDYRLIDEQSYTKYYGVAHQSFEVVKDFVYGLSEVFSEDIASSKRISNPGCFPTAVQLALAPLLDKKLVETKDIVVDAVSGLSGAGKSVREDLFFVEAEHNVKAYKAGVHQHEPEMKQIASLIAEEDVDLFFVPHLIPTSRGIYATLHLKIKKSLNPCDLDIQSCFENYYHAKPFVRVFPEGVFPEMKNVYQSNFCDLSFVQNHDRLVVFSAIDNLMKGAASQAIQNMNLSLGFSETEGLL